MTFTERINLAFKNENARRKAAGEDRLTKTDLWKAAEVSSSAVTFWFDGSNEADLDKCVKVAPLLRVNPWWLFNESAPMQADINRKGFRFNEQQTDYNVYAGPAMQGHVPLISWVQAGDWGEVIDNFAPGDAEEWLACPRKHGPNTFALRVRGVSMEPKYRDGAVIYVDPSKAPDHLSNVVVRMNDEKEATFKQLVIEGNKKFLRPLNPDWPGPKLIEVNGSATVCGVVIGQFIED